MEMSQTMAPSPMNVTKSAFLAGLECARQGWLNLRAREDARDSGLQFHLEQGIAVGKEARKRFPGGKLLGRQSRSIRGVLAAELTSALPGDVFFEAEFVSDHCIARPDILCRDKDGWHLIEVKSATSFKSEYVDDVAYTLMVVMDSGLPITKVSLMVLNPEFELPGLQQDRFMQETITDDARTKADTMRQQLPGLVPKLLAEVAMPEQLIYACKSCDFFGDRCFKNTMQSPIFNLPGLNERQFNRILTSGHTEISTVPGSLLTSEKQQATKKAIAHNKVQVEKAALKQLLDEVRWPAHYLDFETCALAMPSVERVRPYEQLPVQYSLHVYSAPHRLERHEEFLAQPNEDSRDALCRRLLSQVGRTGSVIVYSSFEKTILTKLAERLPRHRAELNSLIERLFDLRRVFAAAVFHPACLGRESIKYTGPAFTDLNYDDLEIKNGVQAIAEFFRSGNPSLSPQEVARIRQSLLAYCKRDTEVMAELHFAVLKRLP